MANNIFQLIKEVQDKPYLGKYIKESLVNKIPFVNRDEQEEMAYVRARAEGLGEIMGRPELPQAVDKYYDEYTEPEWFLDQLRMGPNYKLYPGDGYRRAEPTMGAGGYGGQEPEVQGVQDMGYGVDGSEYPPEYYTTPIPGSRKYTNSEEIYNWTPAPVAQGTPQKALDFYGKYNYGGNGDFANPLNPEYIQILWNEIVQQTPGEDPNNQIALLETMLGIAHAESHGGYDAGYLDRNSNVWNVGFNANKNSVLKYDPTDPRESADRAVNSVINDFGVLKNRGLTDQTIHNYHIGPNATYNQAGVDTYRDYIGGWENLYGPTYPWTD